MELLLSDPEKKISKEHLKALRAIVFEGLTNPTDVKVWLNMLEKCFMVMDFLEERKVKLMTFLLQKQTEVSGNQSRLDVVIHIPLIGKCLEVSLRVSTTLVLIVKPREMSF